MIARTCPTCKRKPAFWSLAFASSGGWVRYYVVCGDCGAAQVLKLMRV